MVLVPEPETGNDARKYVEQSLWSLNYFNSQGQRIMGDPSLVYEFLLAHGKEYSGLPWKTFRGSGWRRMKPQHCFENAFVAADRHGLTYCEGYATTGIFPVHHAWCLDDDNRVVDFTWREEKIGREHPSEWQYFGVAFDLTQLAFALRGKPTWSVLFDLPYADENFIAEDYLAD